MPKGIPGSSPPCAIEDCPDLARYRGWCNTHYRRWRKHGDPLHQRPTREARFWAKVAKGDGTGCWLWQRAIDEWGYGVFDSGRAHRAVWRFTHGPIPQGLHVLHHCDNPPCVRPDHLFLGTQADNMADMVAKGRALRGERNPRAKLTWAIAAEIRAEHATGASKQSLANRFGVDWRVIAGIVTGRTWIELTPKEPTP